MSEQLSLTGKIIKTFPRQTGQGQKGTWERQDFIIETTSQYPKKVLFTAFGADRTAIVNKLQAGAEVKVYFNAESREHNGRWYTQLTCWRVEAVSVPNISNGGTESAHPSDEEDDLPF